MADPLWHAFFDALFAGSSALLAVFLGAALGNVIRGVPLGPDGYFFEPLWTTFTVTSTPGILDWYTVLTGVLALIVLASHGAHFVAVKTNGRVQTARRGSRRGCGCRCCCRRSSAWRPPSGFGPGCSTTTGGGPLGG